PYLASVVLGAGAVAAFGTAAQRETWAAPAGQGSVVLTAALAEPDGDGPRVPPARAERADGRGVASGGKAAGGAAPRAGLLLVPCATPDGVRVFLVTPSDPGVSVEPQRLTDFAPAGRVVLESVVLDDDRALARNGPRNGPGNGQRAEVADWLVARATVGLCAMQSGVIERALELTAECAKNRGAFGRPIGSFPAVEPRAARGVGGGGAVPVAHWQGPLP